MLVEQAEQCGTCATLFRRAWRSAEGGTNGTHPFRGVPMFRSASQSLSRTQRCRAGQGNEDGDSGGDVPPTILSALNPAHAEEPLTARRQAEQAVKGPTMGHARALADTNHRGFKQLKRGEG